jgi:outer membrane cobalamin receptor
MWLTLPRLVGVLSPLPFLIACGFSGHANVITAPELGRSRATNTYDAIRRLRPELLRNRESGALMYFTARKPVVAVDNILLGGVELLRDMPVDQVARIEYVNAWDAAKRYGSGFGNGIMLVSKRTGSEPELSISRARGASLPPAR